MGRWKTLQKDELMRMKRTTEWSDRIKKIKILSRLDEVDRDPNKNIRQVDEKHRDTKSDRHLLSMIHNRRSIESGSDQIETEVQTDAESQEGSKKVRKKIKGGPTIWKIQ